MKSSPNQIESRGFVTSGKEKEYADLSFQERLQLLKSVVPSDRTLAARLLSHQNGFMAIEFLTNALKSEKKLYPKIEICNSLASYGVDVCSYLIPLLGKIGSNQHTTLPAGDFRKDSYPLPRDIVSRILIRIGPGTLPYLLPVISEKDAARVSEAVDAIGFICFYSYQPDIYARFAECFQNYATNHLILWKILRAMSAFPESEDFLMEQQSVQTGTLLVESERSLRIIRKKKVNG